MFHSDLEILQCAKERQAELLESAEQHRRVRACELRRRSRLKAWIGNQLIVLGERVKGDV